MKHVVMRYMSTRIKNLPYGCPGFGDIVHSCLLTYNYGQHYGKPATLHIAPHQYNKMKPQTWKQVMDLFPQGQMYLKIHKFYEESDEAFLQHVLQQYPSAKLHYYEKYPGKLQNVLQPSFFVDEYQRSFPQLKPECYDPILIKQLLPSKFVTAQFDASSRKRNLTSEQIDMACSYWREQGYKIINVGGQARHPALMTAPLAGYTMSRARAHLGVDSGYMHFAQMFLKPSDIYIYTNRTIDKWEHHLKMFKDNGVHINEYHQV